MKDNNPGPDDDFMHDSQLVSEGSGKWTPKRGRTKKRNDIHTVNVDLSLEMYKKLDEVARFLNVSRQSVIKQFCMDGLTKHECQFIAK